MKKLIILSTLGLAVFFSQISGMKKLALVQMLNKHTGKIKGISKFDDEKVLSFSENEFLLWNPLQVNDKKTVGSKENHLTSIAKFDVNKILTASYPTIIFYSNEEEVTGPSTIKLWDMRNKQNYLFEEKEEHGYLDNINKLNKNSIFSHQMGMFLFWNVVTQDLLTAFGKKHHNYTSKEDQTSFCMLNEKKLISLFKKQILMWNPKEKKEYLQTFDGHKDIVRTVQNIDDKKFLSTGYDNVIKLWDIRKNSCQKTFEGHNRLIEKVLLLGKEKMVSHTMREIIVWDRSKNCGLILFETDDNYVETIEKIDNTTIASGHKNGQIKIWNTKTLECLETINGHENHAKILCAPSSDLLLSSCNESHEIKYWKIKSE